MTKEEQAEQCREGLEANLLAVDQITADSAAIQLLHGMNGVMRAAVESEFGTGTYSSIGRLYESIDRVQPGMVKRCEGIPLLFFSRSFAVVCEKAVRQSTGSSMTYPIPCKEQAKSCWLGLTATLNAVKEFTAGATAATGRLLHRMNEVVCAAVDTGSAIGCDEALGQLFEFIDKEQAGMMERSDEKPLLLFARPFAVVIERAARHLEAATVAHPVAVTQQTTVSNETTVPVDPPNTVSERSWGCSTPREDQVEWDAEATVLDNSSDSLSESSFSCPTPNENNLIVTDEDTGHYPVSERSWRTEDYLYFNQTVTHTPIDNVSEASVECSTPTKSQTNCKGDEATVPELPIDSGSDASLGCTTPTESQIYWEEESGKGSDTVPEAFLGCATPRIDQISWEDEGKDTVPQIPIDTVSERSWNCDTPNEATLIDVDEDAAATTDTVPNEQRDTVSEASLGCMTPTETQICWEEEINKVSDTVLKTPIDTVSEASFGFTVPREGQIRWDDEVCTVSDTVPNQTDDTVSEGSSNCETPNEDQIMWMEDNNEEWKRLIEAVEKEKKRRSASAVAAAPEADGAHWFP